MNWKLGVAAVALAALTCGGAQAADTIAVSTSSGINAGASLDIDTSGLDDGTANIKLSGLAAVVQNSAQDVNAQPLNDPTKYVAVINVGAATLGLDVAGSTFNSVSVYIGSLDTYNSMTFHFADNTTQTLTGSQLALLGPAVANGSHTLAAANEVFNFTFGSGVTAIDFNTTSNSFEFDNVSYTANTTTTGGGGGIPEPSVWIMMIAGFGLLGMALRSRDLAKMASV
jgi:hypothetical protein